MKQKTNWAKQKKWKNKTQITKENKHRIKVKQKNHMSALGLCS